MYFLDLFHRGGWVMYVILFVSVYVFAVVLYKFWQFSRLKLHDRDFLAVVLTQLDNQELINAQVLAMQGARLKHHPHPVSRVLESALVMFEQTGSNIDLVREEMKRVGLNQMAVLESQLRGLDLASSLAPLLGLLGTVLGMVNVFSSIETAGSRVDASLLAGGIWQALLTTVFGLIVAVFAQIAHHHFEAKCEAVRLTMNDLSTQLLQKIKK